MDPNYDHSKFETEIYKKWESSGAFSPKFPGDQKPKPSFTIIMPPPNASDPLHIGHARFIAIQDVLIRYHRMLGEPTLWLPGADHAGVETQFVFERKLRQKGQSRFDFDRETLYKMIWEDVQNNQKVMEGQTKRLGASCDWTRFKFTLDPEIVKIVYKTFKKLYDEELIYRGERIINYCPRCGTAYSQLEVDYVERDDELYFLDYGTLTIATTRPETIFADVAVAVNPKDSRYKRLTAPASLKSGLRGASNNDALFSAKIPLINREVPVIADNLVDKDFGTGALKITPAHDATDFEIGQKHKLPIISVIDEAGRMTGTPSKYIGLKAEAARAEVVKDLIAAGKLVKTEKIHHVVGTCYRDHGLIEPSISKQWFLKVKPLVEKSQEAIKSGEVKFVVKRYEKIAKNWYKNLKDWNISRQIVWGMRIPAYRCEKCLEWTITDGETPKECTKCHSSTLTQDPDTFDTWFSSGQWPYATLLSSCGISNFQFPISDEESKKCKDFANFYPTSVMETAYDILPFWVIRMIMLGIYTTGKVPFKEVLIHGLVRDREGQKISKSKGNVINPIEMADKYGADALRMGLLWGALIENDVALSEENINAQRKFGNKLWNASRFVINFTGEAKTNEDFNKHLSASIKNVTKDLEKYELSQAAEFLYSDFWHWYCDEAIENSKKGLISAKQLKNGLKTFLKLLHPFMPFITEQLWGEIGEEGLLISSTWPKA